MQLCFILHTYQEPQALIDLTLARVATVYGNPQVIRFADTGEDRLKTYEAGGAWTHRYLDAYLSQSTCPYLIRIDPDTEVISLASEFPTQDCVFAATFARPGFGPIPHGGAQGFTRGAAERLVGLFLDPRLKSNRRYRDKQDLMMADVLMWTGVTVIDRPDFACGNGRPKLASSTFYHK